MRRLLGLALLLVIAACGSTGSPITPTAPTSTNLTRIIGITGSLAFGDVVLGQSRELEITVTNTGTGPLTISNISGAASIANLLNITAQSRTIAAGASMTHTVRFTPTTTGSFSGTITFTGDQTSGTNTIAMTGTGVGPPVTVTGVVLDSTTRRPVGGVRVSAVRNDSSVQNLGTATTDGNGFYSMVLPSATAISISYSRDSYNFQSATVTFSADTRRDINLVPFWTANGVGNSVFDMPTFVTRVRIIGTYSASGSNFIVRVGGRLVVNEIIGTGREAGPRYEGVHAVTGGVVEITNSRDVVWSFTQTQ